MSAAATYDEVGLFDLSIFDVKRSSDNMEPIIKESIDIIEPCSKGALKHITKIDAQNWDKKIIRSQVPAFLRTYSNNVSLKLFLLQAINHNPHASMADLNRAVQSKEYACHERRCIETRRKELEKSNLSKDITETHYRVFKRDLEDFRIFTEHYKNNSPNMKSPEYSYSTRKITLQHILPELVTYFLKKEGAKEGIEGQDAQALLFFLCNPEAMHFLCDNFSTTPITLRKLKNFIKMRDEYSFEWAAAMFDWAKEEQNI